VYDGGIKNGIGYRSVFQSRRREQGSVGLLGGFGWKARVPSRVQGAVDTGFFRGGGLKMKSVDVYPTSYQWVCPKCDRVNEIGGLISVLECECGAEYDLGQVNNVEGF